MARSRASRDSEVQLFLIRHGVAEASGPGYPNDAKRPLTPHGLVQVRREARGLAQLDITFDEILTSPLARARQTADALAEGLPSHPRVVSTDVLAPGARYAAVIEELGRQQGHARLGLVGHEPDLGQLAARLLGLRAPLEFKKGAVCRVDLAALPPTGPGRLRWFLAPKMLRRLGVNRAATRR